MVCGRAPAQIEFGAFLPKKNLTSGGNNFDYFPKNQITVIHGKCSNSIHTEFGNVKVVKYSHSLYRVNTSE